MGPRGAAWDGMGPHGAAWDGVWPHVDVSEDCSERVTWCRVNKYDRHSNSLQKICARCQVGLAIVRGGGAVGLNASHA